MVTANQARMLFESHGFVHHEAPGFIGFHRTHTDGRKKLLHLFSWSNPKHADAQGIPHSYVVVAPMIDASTLPGESGFHVQEDGRFTVTVKGYGGYPIRTWREVADELVERFLPAFDLPLTAGRDLLDQLNETNHLPPRRTRFSLQRPDAEFLTAEVRDNFSARTSMVRLSPQGAGPRLECVADASPSKPAPASAAVQWAPSGNPLDGIPAEVVRLLAADDGRTFGYGYGPGRAMIFRHEHGEVPLLPGQWIARDQDGTFTVTDDDPNAPKEPA